MASLRSSWVPRSKDKSRSDWSTLRYFHDAVVSCKGEVFVQSQMPPHDWSAADVEYDGCGHARGSCKQPKWTKGPQLEGPEHCISDKNERMQLGCSASAVSGERIVVITQPQWGAYYHFLVDSLPRLVWVREQRPELLKDGATFFHTGITSEQGQAWARMLGITTELDGPNAKMGVGQNRLLEGWWSAKTVVWPPSNGCVKGKHHAEPYAVEGMRSLLAQQVARPSGGATQALAALEGNAAVAERPLRALLIQRDPRKAKARALLNHKELLRELQIQLRGWTVDVFSDYPTAPDVPTTCAMFHDADIIIGPHGAGLSNLMCASAAVPVVEIQQSPHTADFELLSNMLGLPYFGVPTAMSHGGPYSVNVKQVRDVVNLARAVAPRAVERARLAEAAAAAAKGHRR